MESMEDGKTAPPQDRENGLYHATWYDGRTAAGREVLLRNNPLDGLLVLQDSNAPLTTIPLAEWRYEDIRTVAGVLNKGARGPVRLSLEPDQGQLLMVSEQAAIDALAAWILPAQVPRRKARLKRWLLAAAAVWVVCLGLYALSPLMFSLGAQLIPQSWEEDLGRSAQEQILTGLELIHLSRGICPGGQDNPEIGALMRILEEETSTKGYAFQVTLLDADFVNAFALPGGYIVVTTGLIRECASAEELAGVLAHEMAHVTERHGTSRLLREQVWSLLARLGGSDGAALTGLALAVVTSGFDRDQEREADHLGVFRLVRAGIDPKGLGDFFARLEQQSDPEGKWSSLYSYIGSHPSMAERQNNIARSADEARLLFYPSGNVKYRTALDSVEWSRLQNFCPGRTD